MSNDLKNITNKSITSKITRLNKPIIINNKNSRQNGASQSSSSLKYAEYMIEPKIHTLSNLTQKNIDIAIILHIGNIQINDYLMHFLTRIPDEFDLYISYYDSKYKPGDIFTLNKLQKMNSITIYKLDNMGQDIYPFTYIIKNMEKSYRYYLKLHTKSSDIYWRDIMFESVLPQNINKYKYIYNSIDNGHCFGSYAYLYEMGNSPINADIMDDILRSAGCDINIYDYFDTKIESDDDDLDIEFYKNYYPDIKKLYDLGKINNDDVYTHYHEDGIKEGRICNGSKIIEAKSKCDFFAGTIFWFPNEFKNIICDLITEDDYSKFEKGRIINNVPRYTHSWEYLYGLFCPKMGIINVLFVLHASVKSNSNDYKPVCGGTRTLLKFINKLAKETKYNIKICFVDNGPKLVTDPKQIAMMREYIKMYNVIDNINDICFFENDINNFDFIVVTGWQTYSYGFNLYRDGHGPLIHFCQDKEFLFEDVEKNKNIREYVKNFYEYPSVYTISVSNYLTNYMAKLRGDKMSFGTRLGYDVNSYYDLGNKRDGFVINYTPSKNKRLPEFTKELIINLANMYKDKPIRVFGENVKPFITDKNVKFYGSIPMEKLNEFYNEAEIGIVFSNSNVSRLPYEMRGSGLVTIEANNKYTRYDLDDDQFIKADIDIDLILEKIDQLYESDGIVSFKELHKKYVEEYEYYDEAEEQTDIFNSIVNTHFGI